MSNPYSRYYVTQAGSGISGFAGDPYQRGSGFFGRFFSSKVTPFLQLLGRHALRAGSDVAQDILSGENVKTSAKRRLREGAKALTTDALDKVKDILDSREQSGSGIRRKRRRKKRSTMTLRKRRKLLANLGLLKKGINKRRRKRKSVVKKTAKKTKRRSRRRKIRRRKRVQALF